MGLPWQSNGWDFPFNAGGVGLMPGSHVPPVQKTKTQNRSDIVTNSKKTLKMVHIKKKKKPKRMKASLFEAQMSFTSLGNAFHRRSPVL